MSIFSKGKEVEAVLFSPFEGKLTFNGQPAAGAKIKLWVAWKDKEGETEVYKVDEQGDFSIPVKTVSYKDNPLAQISVGQKLTVQFKGHEYLIWKAGKSSINLFGELGGKPIGVNCELADDEFTPHLEHALVETICRWESIEEREES